MRTRNWKGRFVLCLSLSVGASTFLGAVPLSPIAVYAEGWSETPVLSASGMKLNNGEGAVDISSYLEGMKSMTEGTIQIRYRSAPEQGISAMLSMSSTASGQQNTYAVAYVNPSSNTVGVEVRDTAGGNYNQVSVANAGVKDDKWHTISYCFGQETFSIYIDGEKKTEQEKSGFFNKLTSPDTFLIGRQKRTNSSGQWQFTGDIESLQVYDHVLSAGEISEYHSATDFDPRIPEDPEDAVRTDEKLFYNNYENSRAYRIPSLLTTEQGTVIAGIDQRHSGQADCGNIDTVIRRSLDGGVTWGPVQTLIDLPGGANGMYAMTIDPSMVQDRETGRIFLLVDMFSESNALLSTNLQSAHSGYKEVDGERYFILRDYEDSNAAESAISYTTEYTIREGGVVWNEETQEPTEYSVENLTEGTLYRTTDGEKQEAGNIYVYTSSLAGELKAIRTSHLWMMYSDDEGETWSEPEDMNKALKEDWMLFMGTGPGVGYQMENGRLLFPYYATNAVMGVSQSSGVIYSDDHGETWSRGETVCDALYEGGTEAMTGGAMMTESQVISVKNSAQDEILKLFCRNTGNAAVRIFTSEDGGETWRPDYTLDTALKEPYCQLTVVPYPYEVEGYEGRQMFLFANPDASNRSNGALQMGYYEPETDSFVWIQKRPVTSTEYAYSCLSVLGEDRIGLLWEGDSLDINFTTFNKAWLFADKTPILRDAPRALKAAWTAEGEVVVSFDQPLLVMGTPQLKVRAGGSEVLLPCTAGSGSSELVFDGSAVSGDAEVLGLELPEGASASNNEGTSFDPATLTGLKVKGNSEETIHGLSVVPGYATSMIRFTAQPGVTYQIQRSSNKSYGYTTVGEVTPATESGEFQDPVGTGKKYYYRVTANDQQDVSAVVTASSLTGRQAFEQNAEVYRNLSDVTFDGSSVVDLSEYASVLQTMDEGSLIVQFKADQNALQALFNASSADAEGPMSGSTTMASVMTTGDSRIRADLAHGRANSNAVEDGAWHTFMVSCANEGKTFRFVLDGKEDHSWTAPNLSGFLSTVPNLERVTVGGRLSKDSQEVLDGFTGTIEYIAVTSEVMDDASAAMLTAEVPPVRTLEIESVQAGYASNKITLKDGKEASIWRSETADGEFVQVGSTTGGVFRDYVEGNTQYFYKAVSAGKKVESEPVQADRTVSRAALKETAQVYEEFTGTVYDGTVMHDLSSHASDVASLSSGTVIVRYRTEEQNDSGILLMGKKAGETVSQTGASNKAAVSVTPDHGQARPRFDYPHTRASIQQDTADGIWHTVVFTQDAPGAGSTFRMTIDGTETNSFSGSGNTGFFSTVEGMDSLTVGGFLNGTDSTVSGGFKGEIEYVLITDEIFDTQAASRISRQQETADRTLLEQAVTYARSVEKPEHVHPAVWTNFESALAHAQQVLEDEESTQDDVNAAWTGLVQAIHMLSFTADKSGLQELVEQAEALDLSAYETDEAMEEFLAALEAARTVLGNENALDPSIEEACVRLQNAMAALHPKAQLDTYLLEWVWNQVRDTDLSQYANEHGEADAFRDALKHAEEVLADPVSQEQIDEALVRLNSTWMDLRLKPSEALLRELEAAIAETEALDLENCSLLDAQAVYAWHSRAVQAAASPRVSEKTVKDLLDEFRQLQPVLEAIRQGASQKTPGSEEGQTQPVLRPETGEKPAGQLSAGQPSAAETEKEVSASRPESAAQAASVKTGVMAASGWSLMTLLSGLGLLSGRKRKK